MPSTSLKLSRRRLLTAAAGSGAVLLAACAVPPLAPTQAPQLSATPATKPATAGKATKGNVTFWHFWGSAVRRNAIRRVVNSFQIDFPDIRVTEIQFPFGEIWTKAIEAVNAGRDMPDVLVEDRPQLRERARQKIDISLGDLAKGDGIDGKAFWSFTWDESLFGGVPYGLPFETDIRVQFYNRAALADAGLDPSTPPRDWDELWSAAARIDQRDDYGGLLVVAFHPLFGNVGLTQWAWNNGGEWQDADQRPTINSPENVATLEWLKRWVDRYGKGRWDDFQKGFGQGSADGFMSGKVALKPDIAGYASFLNFYNPYFAARDGQRLGWGVGPIPAARGMKPASLSGGFALSIPRGSQQIDAAWEFIKYAVFVGQASWARDTYSIPTVESIARSDPALNADTNWKLFVDAMAYGRPAVYNQYYPQLLDVVGPAQDAVLSGKSTPQQALDEAQAKAEAEIAKSRT